MLTNRELTARLRNATRVDFGTNERVRGQIYGDRRGLFEDGETVTTQTIKAENDNLVETADHLYEVEFAAIERVA